MTSKTSFQFEEKEYIELQGYLLMDQWETKTGLFLLCGWNPELSEAPRSAGRYAYNEIVSHKPKRSINIEGGEFIYSLGEKIYLLNGIVLYDRSDEAQQAMKHYHQISKLWDGCSHPYPYVCDLKCTVSYFIEWAASKRIEIPWLEWAKENNLLPQENINDSHSNTSLAAILKTVALLKDTLIEQSKFTPGSKNHVVFSSQADVINHIEGTHKGLSKRNLENIFSSANKEINS
jgi:hypothetical protein